MDDLQPVDLAALDPARDPVRWELRIAAVMQRAAPELVRRAAFARGPLSLLAGWARPTLAAAAALVVISAAALAWSAARTAPSIASNAGIAEALGLGEPVAEWVAADRSPTSGDLLAAMEDLP